MIKVKNIMTNEVITIAKESSIIEAANLMSSKMVSSPVVVDKSKPIAIVSENDIIRAIVAKKKKISEAMNNEMVVISPLTKFSEVSRNIREKKIKRFPVAEDEKLIGLITETDVVEATRDFTRFHQIIQEIILAIFGLATAFFLFYFSPLAAPIFS